MKELDSFTVERLEEWINTPEKYDHRYSPRINCDELRTLAAIALAAKRAEESHSRREVWDGGNTWIQCSKQAYDRHEAAGKRVRVLYERPQLNSPEIPEGWKLIPIIAYPSQWAAGQKAHNNAGINKVDAVYKAMVAAAPDASGFDPSLPGAEATVITHYYTPDGYKLVPTEITKAMRDAWDSAPNGHEDDDVNMCNAYRAMIAAAPEKPL